MVYLLHFDHEYKGVKHYMGYTDDLEKRLAQHKAGNGARLMEVISNADIGFQISRVWPTGDRKLERRLKNRKNHKMLCPICRAEMKGGEKQCNQSKQS